MEVYKTLSCTEKLTGCSPSLLTQQYGSTTSNKRESGSKQIKWLSTQSGTVLCNTLPNDVLDAKGSQNLIGVSDRYSGIRYTEDC